MVCFWIPTVNLRENSKRIKILLIYYQKVIDNYLTNAVDVYKRQIEHRGAVFNCDDGTLTFGSEKIELTKNEHRILMVLLESKGKIVSRDVLMTRLWESDSYVDDNTLTVNITRLRKKLEQAGLSDFITTKKGSGYLIG